MAKLSGDDWQKLIGELLEAELHVAGLGAADLERSLAPNLADAGIDAFVKKQPPRPTAFLPAGPRIFQFKRTLPAVASVASEIVESDFVRSRIKDGVPYVLVVGSDLGAKREAVAAALTASLKKQDLTANIEVAGADCVLRFLKDHNFAWRYVPDAPPAALHLKTLEQWIADQQKVGTNFPWTEDPERTEVMKVLLEQLQTQGKALRLQGPPGVGKTRLAFELAQRFSATSRDVMFLEVDEAGSEELSTFTGTPMQGLLVIDECSLERHQAIGRNWKSMRGSVLTIGSEDLRNLERDDPTSPWIGPLQPDQMRTLARETPSTLEEPTRVHLAEKSGGYLKLFRLLLDAVKAARPPLLSAINLSQLELTELLVKFITRQNNNDDERARAIRALALPTFVASTRDELPVLATAVGLSKQRLHEAREQLAALALIGSLPGGLYVTPRLLGDWLAERYWADRECDFLVDLKAAGASRSLIWRCVERLAGGSKQGLTSLNTLLTDCGLRLEEALGATAMGELVARLSASHPREALELAHTLVHGSQADLSREGARALDRALGRCAWEPELFDRAAELLTQLTPVDRPTFTHLFGTVMGVTQAKGSQRLALLRRLSTSLNSRPRLLVCGALHQALGEDTVRFMSFPALRMQDAWRPKTNLEEFEYRRSSASLLEALLSDEDQGVRGAALEAVRHSMRSLARTGFMAVVVQLVRAAAKAGAALDVLRPSARAIEEYDLARLDAPARKLWREAQALLAPRTAEDRALAFARDPHVGKPTSEEALSLATDLLREPDLTGLLEVLGKDFAPSAFDIGRALGALDRERRLLSVVREGARNWRSLRFAAGYVLGASGSDEDLLDELSSHGPSARLAFEATWLAPPSERGAQRLLKMLRQELIEPQSFQQLLLGGWLVQVDSATASQVLVALGAAPIVVFQLVFQRVMGRDGDKSLTPLLLSSWEGLGLDEIREVASEWLEVEPLVPAEEVAARCVEVLRASSSGDRIAPDEVMQALASAANRAPGETWLRLAAAAEAMQPEQRPVLALQLRDHLPETEALIDSILAWVGEDAERAAFAAAIALPVTDSEHSLASRLIERFPTDSVVKAHLHDRFMSGMFHQESEFWQDRLDSLRLMTSSSRPAVASWAQGMMPEVERSLSRATEVEQAYAEGVLDIPMLGERLPD